MRENCTYGSMRGRAYPITRGVPLYSTSRYFGILAEWGKQDYRTGPMRSSDQSPGAPLVEKGLVARTVPDNPTSPRQEYKLA